MNIRLIWYILIKCEYVVHYLGFVQNNFQAYEGVANLCIFGLFVTASVKLFKNDDDIDIGFIRPMKSHLGCNFSCIQSQSQEVLTSLLFRPVSYTLLSFHLKFLSLKTTLKSLLSMPFCFTQ